jgi:NAD(P)-dependent dehydrogenase (short-subunit alcohol dehydrogenase family)
MTAFASASWRYRQHHRRRGRIGSAEFAIGGSVNAALMNLTKVIADKGLAEGVNVNAINPDSIATERLKIRITTVAAEQSLSPETTATKMASKLSAAYFGTPNEIARYRISHIRCIELLTRRDTGC